MLYPKVEKIHISSKKHGEKLHMQSSMILLEWDELHSFLMLYVFIHPVVLLAILSLKLYHMSAENADLALKTVAMLSSQHHFTRCLCVEFTGGFFTSLYVDLGDQRTLNDVWRNRHVRLWDTITCLCLSLFAAHIFSTMTLTVLHYTWTSSPTFTYFKTSKRENSWDIYLLYLINVLIYT